MYNWGALIAKSVGKSPLPAWSLTITAEKRPPTERKTDSISTRPKLSPACTKSGELATPARTRCDARFYTRNGGALRSQEQHPRTLRESLHTNSSARSRAQGGHEAVGTRLPAAQADGQRHTPAPTPHAAAAEHRPAPPLSCYEPPSAHPFPPEWRMRARRRSVSLHFVLISFRVPLGFPAAAAGGGGGSCWDESWVGSAVPFCAPFLQGWALHLQRYPPRAGLQAASPLPFFLRAGCSEVFWMCFALISWLGNLRCLGVSPRVGRLGVGEVRAAPRAPEDGTWLRHGAALRVRSESLKKRLESNGRRDGSVV